MTKEEIAQNVQFLLLPQCFPLFIIGYPFNYGDFLCFDKIRSKSSATELSYDEKGNPFPHTTNLQQTTFENFVTKGEIAQQFLLLSQCFQLFLMIKLSFMEIFHIFANMFLKTFAAELLYVGKG